MANSTTLRVAIGTGETTILASSPLDYPQSGVIQIESELIQYKNVTDSSFLLCVRGFAGTSAATHAKGKVISFVSALPSATVIELSGAGAPTNGVTGAGIAAQGSLYLNTTNGDLYENTGSPASTVWTKFTTGGVDHGITQLTGDVTAGPGDGSQAATIAANAVTASKIATGQIVKSIHADAHANLTDAVQLVSGSNVTLTQVGQAITIAASSGGGTGRILQIVAASTSTEVDITNNVFTDTTLTATITPSATSSKILVAVVQLMGIAAAGSTPAAGDWQLLRNGVVIFGPFNVIGRNSGAGEEEKVYTSIYFDSPASVAALTYKTQMERDGNSGGCTIMPQRDVLGGLVNPPTSWIYLIEISG